LFNDADISLCDFRNSSLQQAQFVNANCEGAIFTKSDMTYADFSHARLDNSLIDGVELYRTNLHEIIGENIIWDGSNKGSALPTDQKKSQAENFKP